MHSYQYHWSNLSSGCISNIWYGEDFTGFGTYWLRLTNACGSHTDTFTISYLNPDAPHLGQDFSFCFGSPAVLNPQNSNVSSYHWNTGATTSTLPVNSSCTYTVYSVNTNGCDGIDTINVTSIKPTPGNICYVECDSATAKNKIVWSTNIPSNVDSIKIYKEVSLNVWSFIGAVDPSNSYFIDTSSHPNVQSYSYHITAIDTCGNESDSSSAHTTITLLASYNSLTNTYGFNWSNYIGLPVSIYYLYGVTSSGLCNIVGSVPGNLNYYNYIYPSLAYVNYFVGFTAPVCNNFKSTHLVKSNIINSVLTGIDNNATEGFLTYPNPASDKLIIELPEMDFLQNTSISICNIIGQKILEQKVFQEKTNIDISGLTKGIFIIKLSNKDKIIIRKFVKE